MYARLAINQLRTRTVLALKSSVNSKQGHTIRWSSNNQQVYRKSTADKELSAAEIVRLNFQTLGKMTIKTE